MIHGIPSPETVLKDGDIVKIDVGAFYKGYHGDCAPPLRSALFRRRPNASSA